MRVGHLLLLIVLVLGQTPLAGFREAFSRPRCNVAVCKCRDCAGGANCCCAKARTPLEQMLALSQCDRAEQEQIALTTMPYLISATPLVLYAQQWLLLPHYPLEELALSQNIVPRSPPPRCPFKLRCV